MSDLRLILFDATCKRRFGFGLSSAWRAGTLLYSGLGRADASFGTTSWADGLAWLASFAPGRKIREIQFWGHGKWGRLFVAREFLDSGAYRQGHEHHRALCAIRERLTGDALLWFRTCETFGANAGCDFAQRTSDFFGARSAGHTFVIGYFQSGLHLLRPGTSPHWPAHEGLSQGNAEQPLRAFASSPAAPNTITCLDGRIPEDF